MISRFAQMQRSAYNERFAEVYVRDTLAVHPWRTRIAADATLIYVPIWEVVSFSVGECNHPICHICTTRMRVT